MINHSNRGRIIIRPLGTSYWSQPFMLRTVVPPRGATIIAEAEHVGEGGFLVRLASGTFALLLLTGALRNVDARKVEAALASNDIDPDGPPAAMSADENAELAAMIKRWRDAGDLTAARAAEMLGIPMRTLEGIEQGRGFKYPRLLTLALISFEMTPPRIAPQAR
jgi:DNA-binding XRE family transcriptional regulator